MHIFRQKNKDFLTWKYATVPPCTHTNVHAHTNTENQGHNDLFTDPRKQHDGLSERKRALFMCI